MATESCQMLPSPEGFSGKQYAILALGNPIVDITVEMDEEQVLALGLTAGVDAPPLDDAERQKIIDFCAASPTVAYTPGGAALNTIRVSQSYLNHPEATAYIGAVGSDDLAKVIVDGCDRCGVKTVLQSVDEATGALHLEIENGRSVQRAGTSLSGTCAALICNKDRALAGLPGAARRLSHDFVKANEHLVAASAIVYIDTFALVSPPRVATAMWLAGKTCEYGGRLALNLQSANLLKFNKNARDAIAAMLPLATYIFGNAQELEAYADLQGWEVGSGEGLSLAEKLAAQLGTAHAPAIATITAGGGPTILAERGVSAKYCPPFPVEAVDIVDTNGCGDAFVGGFLAAIAQGAGGDASVAAGHLCARHVLKATGVPTELAALGPWRREQISL